MKEEWVASYLYSGINMAESVVAVVINLTREFYKYQHEMLYLHHWIKTGNILLQVRYRWFLSTLHMYGLRGHEGRIFGVAEFLLRQHRCYVDTDPRSDSLRSAWLTNRSIFTVAPNKSCSADVTPPCAQLGEMLPTTEDFTGGVRASVGRQTGWYFTTRLTTVRRYLGHELPPLLRCPGIRPSRNTRTVHRLLKFTGLPPKQRSGASECSFPVRTYPDMTLFRAGSIS